MIKKSSHKLSQLTDVMRDGEFHDGTALGVLLQMTRSAVWKMIKKLERYGIEINSVKGKGYALCEPLILLNEDKIRKKLTDKKSKLSLFESIDSTNEYLRSIRQPRIIHFCLAEQQTAGRGRLGRTWHSPFGKNIYLSCLYPFQKDISELAGLSLVVSLAILSTMKEFGIHEDVQVKWPNDILCRNKKISGTLIEVQAESHGASHAIIGIGINTNMLLDESGQISQLWTSMRHASGEYLDRNLVCATLMNQLLAYLHRFDSEGFSAFMQEWVAAEGMQGKQVSVKTVSEIVTGEAVGINLQGHLLLKLADGKIRAFSSGDTSVVKQ